MWTTSLVRVRGEALLTTGKVRPPKRSSATRHQRELSQLLNKPEYTYTPIVPFDDETLRTAFRVESTGSRPAGIDLSLLEGDEPDASEKRKPAPDEQPAPPPRKRVVLISKKKGAQAKT